MKRALRRCLLPVLLLALPAACSTPPADRLPELTFAHYEPVPLKVGRFRVTADPAAPLPEGAHRVRLPLDLEAAVRRWARRRFHAAGGPASATLTVRAASATSRPLDPAGGVIGLFRDEPAETVILTLRMALVVTRPDGGEAGRVRVSARRRGELVEGLSVDQRERRLLRLTEQVIADLDGRLMKTLPRYLGAYTGD